MDIKKKYFQNRIQISNARHLKLNLLMKQNFGIKDSKQKHSTTTFDLNLE